MEKRNIQIDLDTARKWYKGNDNSLKILAKQVFTKKELETSLPASWKEYLNSQGGCMKSPFNSFIYDILDRLLILRDVYRQGWKPDWNDVNKKQYAVVCKYNILRIEQVWAYPFIFSFPTEELAEQFLENFRIDLEQLKELL